MLVSSKSECWSCRLDIESTEMDQDPLDNFHPGAIFGHRILGEAHITKHFSLGT